MKRKSMMLVLTLLLVFTTFVSACSSNTGNSSSPNPDTTKDSPSTTDSGDKKNEPSKGSDKEQVLRFNLHSDPPSLDPGLSQDTVSSSILNAMYEGLVRVDENAKPVPGVAEKWEESPDHKKFTFNLRKDAKWSNGDPVTAHDFVFAWERVLNPKTEPAPPYAYQLYYFKNAEAYNKEKINDFSQVGVKALDEHTLEIELEAPTSYFLSLLSFTTYYPVHKSAKDNPKWAAEANTMISNGPFKISEWKHQNLLELAKNEHYYAADTIKFTKIKATMVQDSASELNMYEAGDIDFAGHPTGELPTDQIPVLKETKPDELNIKGIASSYYYLFNNKQAPFNNANIRKALSMAVDRKLITDKVALGGEQPAFGIVPPGITGNADQYRNEVKDEYFKEDVNEAKALLAKGLSELGLKEMPEFTLGYNTNDKHKKIAQAVADMWSKNLNVKVKIENQEWGVYLKSRTSLNYQVARAGWTTDYNDPMSFIDLYMTGSGNNDIGYSNPEFDDLVKKAKTSVDQKERMDLMAKAEKILIQDDQAILPLFYYTSVHMLKPGVKNVFVDYRGMLDFTRGYLE
ncbi:peptide ABC transporter substrate-binding protein [Paenibacillus apiarius]|uniref:peptide ABC transporter substrate-binding protein n=1 Tax=Paenibacillus apiarius TaxID=46240 RepID=UPI00198012FA|nr:peptide ABC transporter substrate-binding protein [Paenibacillus apiarius]MBN3522465.1 peptide ABC transporter substrate-binding protein [Paenibacillus apiarius]